MARSRIAGQTTESLWSTSISHRSISNSMSLLASQANIAGLSREPPGAEWLLFLCNIRGSHIASEKEFSHRAIWGCALRIASHIAVASRDRATKDKLATRRPSKEPWMGRSWICHVCHKDSLGRGKNKIYPGGSSNGSAPPPPPTTAKVHFGPKHGIARIFCVRAL